jgi:hypothetical protein
MKRFSYSLPALAVSLVAGLGLVSAASATPNPNGAVVIERFFNDCVVTNLAVNNAYPGEIRFTESNMICGGGANLHLWNFSEDGGLSSAVFNNDDAFRFGTTLVMTNQQVGTEAGLRLSPWWDQNANGYFNVRLPDGEIACFGGVLPFYTFTGAYGIRYAAGEPIRLEIVYQPNCNTEADPGTIVYNVTYLGLAYSSGPLPFNNCTPGEEAHGCYGIMDNARAGGRAQNNFFAGGPGDPASVNVDSFFDVFFEIDLADCPVQTEASSWGRLKGLYR